MCCLDIENGSSAGSLPSGTADLDMLLWDLASAMWTINARGAVNHFGTEIVIADGAGGPESIRAVRVNDTPTIAAGCEGCNNFQSETVASHGIQGANTEYAAILGGRNNLISSDCDFGVVCGGSDNDLLASAGSGFIGSGSTNQIQTTTRGVICGGSNNEVKATGDDCSIVGGSANGIHSASGSDHIICGGSFNEIHRTGATGDQCAMVGGLDNEIFRGNWNFVGCGQDNIIGGASTCDYANVIGGRLNTIDGDYSTCAGRLADINHDGVTLFADSQASGNKSSVEADTFHTAKTNGRVMENPGMTAGRYVVEKQAEGTATGDGGTLDFTVGTLDTNGDVLNVDFEIQGTRTDGTAGADALSADGHLRARRQAGTVTIFGNTINTDTAGVVASVSVVVSGNNLIVRFTTAVGGGSNSWNVTIDWRARKVTI